MAVLSPSGVKTNFVYTEISDFKEGLCFVNHGELYGFLDTNLHEITEFIYSDVSSYSNGFAMVSRDSLYGFVSRMGVEICPLQYNSVRPFDYGIAPVQCDSLWGIVDSSGVEVIPCKYDFPAKILGRDFIIVRLNGRWGVIDHQEKIRHPFKYKYIHDTGEAWTDSGRILLGR